MAEKCNDVLRIADDEGDNSATMTCGLEQGHQGLHCEQYKAFGGNVIVLWEKSSPKVED